MIVYIYNIGVDLYNGFNGLRHRINWTYFTVFDGLAHPLYSEKEYRDKLVKNEKSELYGKIVCPYHIYTRVVGKNTAVH